MWPLIVAGTDGKTHHRFLREAEAVRLEFIQGLNQAHIEKLSYANDINRNKNESARLRARVDASNWRVLNDFRFQADSASERFGRIGPNLIALFLWCLAFAFIGFFGARRLPETDHG